jgi:phosphoribosylamine--glycine ligase
LGVTALGDSLESAIKNAYTVAEKITWSHKYCRGDIAQKGLSYL